MALLDNYFKRKQMSKLKEVIKIPLHLAEEGVSSLGFEGINFKRRSRPALSGLQNL